MNKKSYIIKNINAKKLVGLLLSGLILCLVSCSDKTDIAEGSDPVSKCFLSKNHKYEDLLTKTDVEKHVSIDEASYKMDVSSTKGIYGYCEYKWKSNRPDLVIEVSGQTITGPDRNFVKLTKLDFYTDSQLKLYSQESSIALFDQSYKKLSQAEYDKLLANLEKEYANNPAGFEQAKGFLDVRMNLTFEPVEALGDRAYWKWNNTYGLELVVLKGVTHFTIETKLSAEYPETLDVAINLAKEVLAKCGA